jgi:hypothetical protein
MQDRYVLPGCIMEKWSKETQREFIIKLTECSKRYQKLPPWVIKAKFRAINTKLKAQGYIHHAYERDERSIDSIYEGLEKEWNECGIEFLKVMVKLARWDQAVKQVHSVPRLARSLWKEDFDGWFGDLQEARWELIDAGYPRWRVRLITLGRAVLLFWSLIQVKCQDLGF